MNTPAKSLLFTLLLASPMIAMADEPTKPEAKPKKDPEVIFKTMDRDNDGFVTEKEYLARKGDFVEQAKKAFAHFDKDGDGKLTLEEFSAKKK
jgi:Ca2+-binding EF-hand superfamily protein